jgi:hypothetical protein
VIPYLTLFVELVKGTAWPALIFGLVYLFRRPLQELMPRVRRAGPTGIELEVPQQTALISKWTGELKQLPGLTRTLPIENLEKTLHTQLESTRVEERVDLLVNRLAVAQLSSVFERVYGSIFGSQIAGLRALVNAGGAVTNADALRYFNEVKSNKPELKVEFGAWLEFLRVFTLVKIENEKISITDGGRDFLLYLTSQNLNENKPG